MFNSSGEDTQDISSVFQRSQHETDFVNFIRNNPVLKGVLQRNTLHLDFIFSKSESRNYTVDSAAFCKMINEGKKEKSSLFPIYYYCCNENASGVLGSND